MGYDPRVEDGSTNADAEAEEAEVTDGRPPTPFLEWVQFRVAPTAALAVILGVVTGYARTQMGFIVGIQGMVAGGIMGYLSGRLGRGDPQIDWTCGRRVRMLVWIIVLFTGFHLGTLSAVHSTGVDGPLEWLGDVLKGYDGEPFFGARRHGSAVVGKVDEVWWVVFQVTDLGLFAFLALVFQGIGYFPEREQTRARGGRFAKKPRGDDDEDDDDEGPPTD